MHISVKRRKFSFKRFALSCFQREKKKKKKKEEEKKIKEPKEKSDFHSNDSFFHCFERKTKGKEKEDHLVNTKTKSVKTRFSYKSGEISINILDVEHLQFMQIVTTANPSMLCLADEARIGPGSARPFILKSHETR